MVIASAVTATLIELRRENIVSQSEADKERVPATTEAEIQARIADLSRRPEYVNRPRYSNSNRNEVVKTK